MAQCVDAPADVKYKGKRLVPVAIDSALPWEVVKFWYPQLQLENPPAAPTTTESGSDSDEPGKHPVKHRPRKKAAPREHGEK